MASSILQDEMPPPSADEAAQGIATRFRPYPSTKYTVTRSRYVTSSDPRGFIPVYEYLFNDQWLMVDSDTGYVLWTGIWKALGKTKSDTTKMIEVQPELAASVKRIRGGYLKIQGTWMPYEIALRLARKVAWPIRDDLVPLFGPTFPSTCIAPDQPGYGLFGNGNGRRKTRRKAGNPLLVVAPAPVPTQLHESTSYMERTQRTTPMASTPPHGHTALAPTVPLNPYISPGASSSSTTYIPHPSVFSLQNYRSMPTYPLRSDCETEHNTGGAVEREQVLHQHRYAPFSGAYPYQRAHLHLHGHEHGHEHGHPHGHGHAGGQGFSDTGHSSFSTDPYRTRDGLMLPSPLSGPPLPLLPPTRTTLSNTRPTDNQHTPLPPPPSASSCTLPPISSFDRNLPRSGGSPDDDSLAVLRRLMGEDAHDRAERPGVDRDARVEASIPSQPTPSQSRPRKRRRFELSGPLGNVHGWASGSASNTGNAFVRDPAHGTSSRDMDSERGDSSIYLTPLARSSQPNNISLHAHSSAPGSQNTNVFGHLNPNFTPYAPVHGLGSSGSASYTYHAGHHDHGSRYALHGHGQHWEHFHMDAMFDARGRFPDRYPDAHSVNRDHDRSVAPARWPSPDYSPIAGPSSSSGPRSGPGPSASGPSGPDPRTHTKRPEDTYLGL